MNIHDWLIPIAEVSLIALMIIGIVVEELPIFLVSSLGLVAMKWLKPFYKTGGKDVWSKWRYDSLRL